MKFSGTLLLNESSACQLDANTETASMQSKLRYFFDPKSVAVVGASDSVDKIGGRPIYMLRTLGYSGSIYPVNKRGGTLQGIKCYQSLRDLPEPPDTVIVAVPARAVQQVVEDAVAVEAKCVILLSSGFAETGDAADISHQQQIAERLAGAGIPLLGPNCLGSIDVETSFTGTFSPMPLMGMPKRGHTAIVSQSGAVGAYLFSLAVRAKLGLSKWVTTGNEATISTADFVLAMARDPDTHVIMLFLEGIREGKKLQHALKEARLAGKPVVVCKVGRTVEGAKAAQSHTASLAGEDSIYAAIFEQTGAVRVSDLTEMISVCKALDQPIRPKGLSAAIVTVSGGIGTLMADSAVEAGLAIPPLPVASGILIRDRVPFGSVGNPIDVTAQINTDKELLGLTLSEATRSGLYSGVLLFIVAPNSAPNISSTLIQTFSSFRKSHPTMPIYVAGVLDEMMVDSLREEGVVYFEDPSEAVKAFAVVGKWHDFDMSDLQEPDTSGASYRPDLTQENGMTLNEVQALNFFQQHGLKGVEHRVVHNAAQAVEALASLGGKVVLKIVSKDILHKSDIGGVRIGLREAAAVKDAYSEILHSVTTALPSAHIDGMLVASMLDPRLELILGARWDPTFGAALLIGYGGTSVEILGKTRTLALPASRVRVRNALEELGILKIMAPFRGRTEIAREPLIEYISRFAALASKVESSLDSMEINPLFVTEDGIYAADAVVQWRLR